MSLAKYRKKRHFKKTAEPRGKSAKSAGRRYLIQKHDASRLHYDFRLEMDGVLKSWAVPKGPSLDPKDRRLAVHVEDHPIEYGDFEGTIPQGEYGGGTVMLWDTGAWEPLGDGKKDYAAGNLKFRLDGEKLRGNWALVRMKPKDGEEDKNWLLIKEKDEEANPGDAGALLKKNSLSVKTGRSLQEIAEGDSPSGEPASKAAKQKSPKQSMSKRIEKKKSVPEKNAVKSKTANSLSPESLSSSKKQSQPAFLSPELATLIDAPPEGEEWLNEIKFDGYRLLAHISAGKARMLTRKGNDWTSKFLEIAREAEMLGLKDGILDGEAVALSPDGVSDFQELQNALKSRDRGNLVYFIFDIPFCNGFDLTRSPLLERKEFLRSTIAKAGALKHLRFSDHMRGDGQKMFAEAAKQGLEGIVSKRADSVYASRRTRDWLKIKCSQRQEFAIGGFTAPQGSRKGFGALLLGYFKGKQLIYCGRVGTGFDEKLLGELHARLLKLKASNPSFANPPRGPEAKGVTWVKPELAGEVSFSEWTDEGMLRHPSFLGLRLDKPAKEAAREMPDAAAETESKKSRMPSDAKTKSKIPATGSEIAGINITHPGRIIFPEAGITKFALAQYYVDVADRILPHIAGRPLSIVRCPEGRAGQCFFQKHANETMREPIRGIPVKESAGKSLYIGVDDSAGLAALVQYGGLEIHAWLATEDVIEKPDRMIFDLDPGDGIGWTALAEAAQDLRKRLKSDGLESFLKTTGGKGLHVVVPLSPGASWDEVKGFAHEVALQMAEEDPAAYVASASKAKRAGKIYIDYLRNGRGATAVAPYSVRAREGATVSAPLRWEEIQRAKALPRYDIDSIRARLKRLKKDPWDGFHKLKQKLPNIKSNAQKRRSK